MASIVVSGDTSGSITLAAPAVAGSNTLTLPVASDTLVGLAATQTLTNKTLGAGTTFPASLTPALVWLGSATASASASLPLTSLMSSTYDQYVLMFESIVPSATDYMYVQFSTDNGSTWKTTGYINNTVYLISGGPGYGAPTVGIDLKGVQTYIVSDAMYGNIIIANVNGGRKVHAYGNFVYDSSNTPVFACVNGRYDTAATINAIRMIPASGTITSGTIRLYGVKN